MPTRPSKDPPCDPATEEALRCIEEARKSGARKLDLSRLELSALPEAIGQLSQLEELDLSGNQLNTLPEAIGQLSQLEELDLSGNQLSTLPEAIGRLSQLEELNLSGNQLSTLPEAIGRLPQLQMLDLHGNQLSTVPEAIGRLPQLQKLDLSNNQLSTLPEAIGRLPQLQMLDLHGNQLSTLPEAIGRLSQLQELNLSGNQLSMLPEAVQRLEGLEKLFLHGNPALGLPDEVLGPTLQEVFRSQKRSPKPSREILDYYFATRGAKGRALREVKLIVVGRGGAGKTSLVKRLKGEPFDPNERETHGINIGRWTAAPSKRNADRSSLGSRPSALSRTPERAALSPCPTRSRRRPTGWKKCGDASRSSGLKSRNGLAA
jgi:Leucine-rich repeat (LRR) protein